MRPPTTTPHARPSSTTIRSTGCDACSSPPNSWNSRSIASAMAYMPPCMNHTPYTSSIMGMIMYSEGPS